MGYLYWGSCLSDEVSHYFCVKAASVIRNDATEKSMKTTMIVCRTGVSGEK